MSSELGNNFDSFSGLFCLDERNESMEVVLRPLETSDRERFIKDNQWAFKYVSMQEFGMRNNQFEEDEEYTDDNGLDFVLRK